MVFIPPIGRPTSAAAEGIAEDAGFKPGEVLEGKVVRRVGERYLFVDIGRQLRVKIHWELPFEVKPGEILNFEVVSDDPLTFKLVDSKSEPPTTTEPYREDAGGEEKVDIHPDEREPPSSKITYGPLRGRVVPQPPQEPVAQKQGVVAQDGEPAASDPSPSQVASKYLVDEDGSVQGPESEMSFNNQHGILSKMVDPRLLEDLISIFNEQPISEEAVSLLGDEPFFSLYGEGGSVEESGVSGRVSLLKNLMLQGLSKEELVELKQLFSGMRLPNVTDLIEMFGESVSPAQEEPPSPPAPETGPKDIPRSQTSTIPEPSTVSQFEPVPEPSDTNLPTSEFQEPLPALGDTGSLTSEPPEVANEIPVSLAEDGTVGIPLEKGGESLAIRVWPATSRFTIESSTPPPPGLQLDVGDMLQGRIVEVEGTKVIIDFGSFETQATWEAAHTVRPGATIKVMVASLLPQMRLRLVDEAPFKGFMAKLGSTKGWGSLFARLKGAIQNLPLIQADKGESMLFRTLVEFMQNNGLSTEARMARVVEGELPPEELQRDLKLQLAQLIARGGDESQMAAAKELMQSIGGHQLLNVQTHQSGFFIVPLVVAYHQRIDEWRMTVSEDEAEGERWFRLTLLSSPPGIGTIRIDLSYAQRSKRLDMLFWVEQEGSKELVERALPLLKDEFAESRVNLTRVEVGVSKQLSQENLPIDVKRPYLLQTRV